MQDYDVTGITQEFLVNRIPERAELVRFFTGAMNARVVKALVAEIGNAAANNGTSPIQTVGLGLMYGMTLGVLLEKDRVRRERSRRN
jgi:hypothetical protein